MGIANDTASFMTGRYYRNYYCRLRLSSAFLTRCVKFISRTIILGFTFDFDLKDSQ